MAARMPEIRTTSTIGRYLSWFRSTNYKLMACSMIQSSRTPVKVQALGVCDNCQCSPHLDQFVHTYLRAEATYTTRSCSDVCPNCSANSRASSLRPSGPMACSRRRQSPSTRPAPCWSSGHLFSPFLTWLRGSTRLCRLRRGSPWQASPRLRSLLRA